MDVGDFWTIIDLALFWASKFFVMMQSAVLIDSPAITLFELALGFLVLDLLVDAINRLRGGDPLASMAKTGSGKHMKNQGGK